MVKKITIIGIGNGAFAAAADLTLKGYEITLYANKKYASRIEELFKRKRIVLTGVGQTGEADIHKVTTDLEDAIKDTDLIMTVLPAYGLKKFAEEIAPYLKRGHRIVLAPGSTGGALIVSKVLHEKGKLAGVKIAEMHTLPYACRKTGPTSVKILLECSKLYFAAFPRKYNEEMYNIVKKIYPSVELVHDVLETSLNNGNPVSHPAPVVLNAGKIEYFKGEHYHYKEGITPSVAKVIEKIDKERQEICKKFGYKIIDVKDRLYKMGYVPKRETLYECYRDSESFRDLKGPKDLNDRYLTEDTPCSLVLLSNIGHVVGVKTPVMDSVVTLASSLKDENYWETGYTVEDLGLNGMNLKEIKDFLQNGYEY
ncbi:NAD/NADP-dependent octopine/nopaline dehydrogenase family protein [Crassaminicella indica]|uniref:NAD/NADP octopine/nopaline dehydrogenase family protein n=1 Tax=Crassaminicella indica TaxID=2855394 RepID=A0ABX8RF26_9CLOT|nr:NAD/NADP-dependent octopine/nopaline dehydrogenase family protein [Crassaminicella indica]QXM06515.1 NAD/NADP octopine/nopaline dehydrogenase family protein [Crassaminicella indica]